MDNPAENFTAEFLKWLLIFPKENIIRDPQIDIQMQCYITSSAKVNYLLIDRGILFQGQLICQKFHSEINWPLGEAVDQL